MQCLVLLVCVETMFSQGTAGKFADVDRILNVELEKTLREYFLNDNPNARQATIDSISFQTKMLNLSHPTESKSDYLIVADLETGWKEATTIILGFVNREGKYQLKFKWLGWNKSYQVRPELVDIDSDSVKEILIIEDDSGNQSTHEYIRIWKYIKGQFREVFKHDLAEWYGSFPYGYQNQYSFKQNPQDAKLQDIQFIIDCGIDVVLDVDDFDYPATLKEYGQKLPKHVHQEVVFSFNGTVYVPNKRIYDYRKPILQYLHKSR